LVIQCVKSVLEILNIYKEQLQSFSFPDASTHLYHLNEIESSAASK